MATDWRERARQIAAENNLDPELFDRMIQVESSYNPDAVSKTGALGLTQLMPDTARELGVNPTDPEQNMIGGARYLRQMLDQFGNDPVLALAAYNAGPGSVRRFGGVPPFQETHAHLDRIFGSDWTQGSTTVPQMSMAPAAHNTPIEGVDPATYDAMLGLMDQADAQQIPEAPLLKVDINRTWTDFVGDIVADQLDPLNLALLAVSLPVGGFAYRAAAKAVGAPLLEGVAMRIMPNALTTAGSVVGKKLFPRLVEGGVITTLFAAPELVEQPEDGTTRMGNFLRNWAFMEGIDMGLVALGVPFARIGATRRNANRTLQLSLEHGATPERAAADAILSQLDSLRSEGVPPDILQGLAESARSVATTSPREYLEHLKGISAPQLERAAANLGLDPATARQGIQSFWHELERQHIYDTWTKEAELNTATMQSAFTGAAESMKNKKEVAQLVKDRGTTQAAEALSSLFGSPQTAPRLAKAFTDFAVETPLDPETIMSDATMTLLDTHPVAQRIGKDLLTVLTHPSLALRPRDDAFDQALFRLKKSGDLLNKTFGRIDIPTSIFDPLNLRRQIMAWRRQRPENETILKRIADLEARFAAAFRGFAGRTPVRPATGRVAGPPGEKLAAGIRKEFGRNAGVAPGVKLNEAISKEFPSKPGVPVP